jgi:hypothetical protein
MKKRIITNKMISINSSIKLLNFRPDGSMLGILMNVVPDKINCAMGYPINKLTIVNDLYLVGKYSQIMFVDNKSKNVRKKPVNVLENTKK